MKSRFLKNGLYNVAAGIVRIGLAIVTIPVLIRLLGIEEYGLWTLASAVVGIVGLAEAGLATTTTVFVSQDLGKEDVDGLSQTLTVTFGSILVLATLAAIILWLAAETIVLIFPKLGQAQQSAIIQALKFGSLVVWAKLLQQVLVGVEQAYQRYGLLNLVNTVQWLLLSLGFFAVAWSGGRTVALMQWQVLTSIATLLSHIWVVRKLLDGKNIHPFWNIKKAITIARYSLITWLTILGTVIFTKGDRLIIASLLGSRSVGIYSAIVDVTSVINSFSALPIQPIISNFSYFLTHHDTHKNTLQQQLKQAIQINAIVAFSLGAALLTFTPLLIQLIIQITVTDENVFNFQLATIIYAFYSLNAVGYFVLFAVNAVKLSMLNILASSILALLLISIGANTFGLAGAFVGNSGYLMTLFLPVFAIKKMNMSHLILFKWLKIPILFFLFVIISNIVLPKIIGWYYYQFIGIFILAITCTMMFFWFITDNKINIKYIVQKI